MDSTRAKVAAAGVRVGSAAAGGYLSTVLGPEAGAAVAETISEAGVQAVGWLEERATDRVTRTLTAASDAVAERIAEGEEIRGELRDQENEGAIALLESVIEAAVRSAEDRKCLAIANTYAAIAFDLEISIDDALLLVRRLRDSSWRQLVALVYLSAEDRADERFEIFNAGIGGQTEIRPALITELTEMSETLGLVGLKSENGVVGPPSSSGAGNYSSPAISKSMRAGWSASPLGAELLRLTNLNDLVQGGELEELANSFAMPPRA